jgi:ATP-GRASP peptide maturase of grasp-with-spasm system
MSKIVIFSENGDSSTLKITQLIFAKNVEVERINTDDENLQILSLNENHIKVNTSFGIITLTPKDFYWFRRASYYSFYVLSNLSQELGAREKRIFELQEKKQMYESMIYWILNNCRYSCNPFFSVVSKINVLYKAVQCNLTVPQWLITTSKKDLLCFLNTHHEIATKTFTPLNYTNDEYSFKNLTNRIVHTDDLKAIPDTFPETFFQKYIAKKYELRAFYFHGKFYTMAILSQNDNQTEIDFRHYNKKNPNRRIPFILPSPYATKLKNLAKILQLDTGSFDILIDKNDKYYFLEVNPVGQFGMVSTPCNYNIEQHIANKLIFFLHNIENNG